VIVCSGWLIAVANHVPLLTRWRINFLEINASSISRMNESSHFVIIVDHDNMFKNLNEINKEIKKYVASNIFDNRFGEKYWYFIVTFLIYQLMTNSCIFQWNNIQHSCMSLMQQYYLGKLLVIKVMIKIITFIFDLLFLERFVIIIIFWTKIIFN